MILHKSKWKGEECLLIWETKNDGFEGWIKFHSWWARYLIVNILEVWHWGCKQRVGIQVYIYSPQVRVCGHWDILEKFGHYGKSCLTLWLSQVKKYFRAVSEVLMVTRQVWEECELLKDCHTQPFPGFKRSFPRNLLPWPWRSGPIASDLDVNASASCQPRHEHWMLSSCQCGT